MDPVLPVQDCFSQYKQDTYYRSYGVAIGKPVQQTGDYFFIIYCGNNNRLMQYRSQASGKTTWTDNLSALSAGPIHYAIQAVFKDGRKNNADHTVTITV